MKSIKTMALVTGLLALSGVSQAQFSSTWTAVSDYDFRGFSQSAKNPALQGSADYAFGDSGFSIGAWASNVDFGSMKTWNSISTRTTSGRSTTRSPSPPV